MRFLDGKMNNNDQRAFLEKLWASERRQELKDLILAFRSHVELPPQCRNLVIELEVNNIVKGSTKQVKLKNWIPYFKVQYEFTNPDLMQALFPVDQETGKTIFYEELDVARGAQLTGSKR